MKSCLWFSILLLLVSPALAQDDDGGFGGGLFGDGDVEFSDSGSRGGSRTAGPGPVDRINEILAKGGQPLTGEQRGTLQSLLDEQMDAIRAALEAAFPVQGGPGRSGSADGQPGGAARQGGAANSGGSAADPSGGRGGSGPAGMSGRASQGERRPPNPALLQQEEIYLAKVMPVLTPEQQQVWKKFQNDQIRARGGYPALRLALEEAGSAPTTEQETKLQVQFRNYNQKVRELRMAAGQDSPPDAAKLKELEAAHLVALVQLLDPAQRKALIEWRRASQGQPKD